MSEGNILEILGILVGLAIAGIAGWYIVKGQKITGTNDASVTTVTMLSGQIAALTSAQELARSEIDHLKQMIVEKDRTLERNAHDITQLQEALTQRAEVAAFRVESRRWFESLARATGAEMVAIEPK